MQHARARLFVYIIFSSLPLIGKAENSDAIICFNLYISANCHLQDQIQLSPDETGVSNQANPGKALNNSVSTCQETNKQTNYTAVTVCGTCLGSWGADVFHALDAADAAVWDFGAGQADVVPVAPLTIKPAAGA